MLKNYSQTVLIKNVLSIVLLVLFVKNVILKKFLKWIFLW